MLFAIGLMVLGLTVLVLGGDALLKGAIAIARLSKMSPALIGLTVVAAATSVPELAVSMLAAISGTSDIAVGNVVGSNIVNASFILGISALCGVLVIGGNTIKLEYPVLALVTYIAVVLCLDGQISRLEGLLLISIYLLFTAYMISLVRGQMNAQEAGEFGESVEEIGKGEPTVKYAVLFTVAGVLLLALGAQLTVTGAVDFAKLLGISDRVVGLTIVAIGTSLPEIIASVLSVMRGRSDVAVGNVIGSNLFNILVILGLTSIISPIPISAAIIASDNWWMLGITLLLFPLMFTGLRITRREGTVLILVYATYVALLLQSNV